ncbi:unnamed protein product [Paramecium sonneborni]|uniref:WD40 repeat-containing protein n=1 Tax=Paramecium sonneborni TaxID=65129 RepID=A0A8S1QL73_9CILI|nr:unnamed protein product [Paramecium sonneborni]
MSPRYPLFPQKLKTILIRETIDFIKNLILNFSEKPFEEDVNLNLIDQSVNQENQCQRIVFNSSGSIMVSTNEKIIKIWNFNNGKIELLQNLEQHNGWFNCLIYSRLQDAFLSGSDDATIRIWKLKNNNSWISSLSYQQHTGRVQCLILNQNEDQLFSGGQDNSIKVWQLDFSNDKLIYQYSLDKHKCFVLSLSLNQSESLLVSCGDGDKEIIIWERGIQNGVQIYCQIIQQLQWNQTKVYKG